MEEQKVPDVKLVEDLYATVDLVVRRKLLWVALVSVRNALVRKLLTASGGTAKAFKIGNDKRGIEVLRAWLREAIEVDAGKDYAAEGASAPLHGTGYAPSHRLSSTRVPGEGYCSRCHIAG
jgi:hypothetical protein